MLDKRVLTIQDISCVGRCSMTVALPVLSACGLESCALPTAVLSTHSGGFTGFTYRDLSGDFPAIEAHWQRAGITFDGFLTGYLGRAALVNRVLSLIDVTGAPGSLVVADPAMADGGRLYAGIDRDFPQAAARLCRRADYILPNLTEACLLTGLPLRESCGPEDAAALLDALGERFPGRAVLTGIPFSPEETGAALYDGGELRCFRHPRFPQKIHGIGDAFAAAFTGCLLRGLPMQDAARTATDFAAECARETAGKKRPGYGVRFEPCLGKLARAVGNFSWAPLNF